MGRLLDDGCARNMVHQDVERLIDMERSRRTYAHRRFACSTMPVCAHTRTPCSTVVLEVNTQTEGGCQVST